MSNNYATITSSTLAAVCFLLGASSQAADEMKYPLKGGYPEIPAARTPPMPPSRYPFKIGYSEIRTADNQPAKYNKASGLIGMEVCNQKDERLGQIKDVVFDLKSERVSYAVVSSGSGLFLLDEKLIAVPLSAFTASSDQKHLILNADQDKFASAMGFPQDKWPRVENPTWGAEPFWMKGADKSDLKLDERWDSELDLITPEPDTEPDTTD